MSSIQAVNADTGIRTIAFLGTYPPRKCGIATFTSDLLGAVAETHPQSQSFAVAVNDGAERYRYPDAVRCEIEERGIASYRRAADFLNGSGADAVSLQHEYGIFGGPAGGHLLALLHDLRVPVVTTLHTVLRQLNYHESRVMREVLERSTRLVVMTERARTILCDMYRVSPAKIDCIPHGIPDVPYFAPERYKDRLGLSGKKVLLTFGLIYPHKGIENVLHAMPEVVAEFPDVVYVVLGATHPVELRARGEAYRTGLQAIVDGNGTADHVVFENRFVELSELTRFIGAADIYITPYLGPGQASSGTLSYAFGAGKPVISTPYWHAAELLRDGRGALVPFADPAAIAREVRSLLRDPARRRAMSENAFRLGREMVWSNVARLYMASFAAARRQAQPARGNAGPRKSPPLDPGYLYHMMIRPFYSSARESLRRNCRGVATRMTVPGRATEPRP